MTNVRDFGDVPAGWSDPDEATADPDLGPALASAAGGSDLDLIAAELTAKLTPDEVALAIPGRDGWVSFHRVDFTARELDGLRRQSRDKKLAGELDGIKFAALLLGLTCTRIERNGTAIELGGKPATYASRDLQAALGTAGVHATVTTVYGGLEPNVDAAAKRLMDEAGWGDEAPDPTV